MRKAIRRKKGQPQTNRGGIKREYEGITFDSGLELYIYKRFKEEGIEAEYTPITFELLPKIVYEGNDKKTNNVLPLKYTPDFVGEDFIVEGKGYANESFALRWKLFKHYLYNNNLIYQLYIPHNQKEVEKMIVDILKRKKENIDPLYNALYKNND